MFLTRDGLLLWGGGSVAHVEMAPNKMAAPSIYTLLLLRGRHQRHCCGPSHKSHNLMRAVWLILSAQYQQKPSADTVESQLTARCWPRSNNKPFNVGESVLYEIYGTQVVVSWRDKALGFASCCISHSTTPLMP